MYDKEFYEGPTKEFVTMNNRISDQVTNMLELVQPKQGELILDVGCGAGKQAAVISRITKVAGIDSSPLSIDYSTKLVKEKGNISNFEAKTANANKIPYKNNTFDKVIAIDLIEHMTPEDNVLFIKEAKRVLKPQGGIYIYIHLTKTIFLKS